VGAPARPGVLLATRPRRLLGCRREQPRAPGPHRVERPRGRARL